MALTTIVTTVIGYLVCVISTLPVNAYHKNLESDEKLPDKFLKQLGLLNPNDALKQIAKTYEDAPLKHNDDHKLLWPSVTEIVKSMEEDRMTKYVVSDVVLGRYQRSPKATTYPDNVNMRDGNRSKNNNHRSGRAAQVPPGVPQPPIPTGVPSGMPDAPKPPSSN